MNEHGGPLTNDRPSTVERNAANGKKLTSINLPIELWDKVDAMADRNGMNRSALMELIVADFFDNARTVVKTIS